uniref:protein-tyrosine-phosphatase n=1 Tax=Seriola dumerili TaxID=41447 RepID=A0A3B4VMU2_SERDU
MSLSPPASPLLFLPSFTHPRLLPSCSPAGAELQSVPLLARSPSTNRKYPPLPVDKLEEEMNRRMADDNKLFREEFNALPVCPIQASCDAASKEENKEKNRYVNILPYDHSRVHLSSLEGVPDSDFINASFINGYQEKNKFIAAQGPKEETVNDFWRMIWEQNTATIVMVTNLKERKECKCAQYWPDQGCWTYGNIRVSVEDTMVLVDYTIRKFCIQQKPQRLVTQFHFTSWPDFGVPFTPIGMLKFLKKVKTCNPQYAGPIVVHCSAGVGRTGTFIVIDAMLDMMIAERKVDVFGFVTRIRAQRCQMVQTDMQYVFIFQALLEHYLYGDTELEVTSLESHLAKLYTPSPGAGCSGLEAEFKKLTSIKIQNDKMRTGNLPANMKKNRNCSLFPCDILTAPCWTVPMPLLSNLHPEQNLLCVRYFCTVCTEIYIFACVCVCLQCWRWPDRDFLCVEYSAGEGEGRGHPGCLPDCQEPQTAETPHGADTGKGLNLYI